MTAVPYFRRNLSLLAVCWAVVSITNMLNVSASALVGHMLAEEKALATLPIALQWVGISLCTVPASFLMSRVGRVSGFMVAGLIVMVGAATSIYGIYERSFGLYCLASLLFGAGQGFSWYYRFAAAEASPPAWKSRAISLVFAGGVISGILGPWIADFSKDMLAPVTFAGAYVSIVVLQLAVIALLAFVRIPKPPATRFRGGRPLGVIARQPKFIVAATAGIVAYAGMVMLMSVTPLAMQLCGLSFYQATSVIQWHVLGMFLPAFFTGELVRRYGTYPIMLVGGVAMAACLVVALAGQTFWHFLIAQCLLGVAWNFLYVGATTLLTETYTVEERAKTQALNELLVFTVTGLAIFFSGQMLHNVGWNAVNWGVLPLVLATIAGTTLLWVATRKAARRLPPQAAVAGAD